MSLPAQQYAAMRGALRGALAGNNPLAANPSDQEVLGFFKQLFSDASGAPALSASKQAAMNYAARVMLTSNAAGVANPSDADVAAFWPQVVTDSSAATNLSAQRYLALRSVLRTELSSNYPGVANPSEADMLGYFGAFGSVATPLTIFTSGGAPVLWLRGDLGMTGATTITAWKDQASTHDAGPLITAPGIAATDATLSGLPTVHLTSGTALRSVLALSTTFSYRYVIKPVTWSSAVILIGDSQIGLRGAVVMAGVSPDIYLNNTSYVDNVTPSNGTWYRGRADFTGSTSDLLRLGSLVGTGANAGSSSPANIDLNAAGGLAGTADFYIWELVVLPYKPTPAEDTAFDAYVSAKTGGVPLF